MAIESDVASQVVSMTLDGVKTTAEITGKGLEKVGAATLAFISLIHKKQKEHKALSVGEKKLDLMRKSGNVLQDFIIPESALGEFKKNANAFRLTYSLIRNKRTGEVIVVGYQSEASRLSRIVEGLQLLDIQSNPEITETPLETEAVEISPDTPFTDEQVSDLFELLNPNDEDMSKAENDTDPFVKEKDKSSPSEVGSKNIENEKDAISDTSEKSQPFGTKEPEKRPSVRGRIQNIVAEQKEHAEKVKENTKESVANIKKAVDSISK